MDRIRTGSRQLIRSHHFSTIGSPSVASFFLLPLDRVVQGERLTHGILVPPARGDVQYSIIR